MSKPLNIWQLALDCLHREIPVALLVVINSQGSSPGRQGFKMVVSKDGRMAGSIGGGIMEQNLVNEARELASSQSNEIIYKHLIHHKHALENQQSGMICAGNQDVTVCTLKPLHLSAIEHILDQEKPQNTLLEITPNAIIFNFCDNHAPQYVCKIASENNWLYQENLNYKKKIYIIGGGHVSLALSKVLTLLDYHITVIDNRKNLHTLELNTFAHSKHISEYDQIESYIDEGPHVSIAIMTFSYPDDVNALRQVINKDRAYLGLMGSPAKINKIYKELKLEGHGKSAFEKIDAPIGLPIHSKTPEEIAISIAGKMIECQC